MIKAVARSHDWMQKLTSGEVASIQQICKTEKITAVYLRRILRCATLAPDIVQLILEGRQPVDLNQTSIVFSEPPLIWSEQRHQYGIVAGK